MSRTLQSPARIFRKYEENFIFALTGFFLSVLLWEIVSGHTFSTLEINVGYSFAKLLFLNQAHVAFTFLLFLYSPNVRAWYVEKETTKKYFRIRTLAVFVLSFALYYFWLRISLGSEQFGFLFAPILAGIAIVGLHHNCTQGFGLSLLYNREAEKQVIDESDRLKIWVLEQWERWLFRAAVFFSCAASAGRFVIGSDHLISHACGVFAFAFVIPLLCVVWSYPGTAFINKKIFCLRYLFLPLVAESAIPFIALFSLHGIEYLCVFRKMQRNANVQSSMRTLLPMVAIVLVFVLISLPDSQTLGWWLRPRYAEYRWLLDYSLILFSSFGFLHFHLDALLFRMQDPVCRKHISPLLISPHSFETHHMTPPSRTLLTQDT